MALWDETQVAIEDLYQTIPDIPLYKFRLAQRRKLIIRAWFLGICPKLIVHGDDGGCFFVNWRDHLGTA